MHSLSENRSPLSSLRVLPTNTPTSGRQSKLLSMIGKGAGIAAMILASVAILTTLSFTGLHIVPFAFITFGLCVGCASVSAALYQSMMHKSPETSIDDIPPNPPPLVRQNAVYFPVT